MSLEFDIFSTQYLLANRWSGDPRQRWTPVEHHCAQRLLDEVRRSAPDMLWDLPHVLSPTASAGGDGDEHIARRLAEALRDGTLVLYQRRGVARQALAAELPVTDLSDLAPAGVEEDAITWIEFQLKDQNDEPIPLLQYEITDPASRVLSGRLSEQGIVHLRPTESGSHKIQFLEAELVELGEDGPNVEDLEDFGVTSFAIKGAGGEESPSWTSDDAPPAAGDAVEYFIAPEAETVKLTYTIEDPQGRTERAALEVFILDDDGDEQVLWTRDLETDEYAQGEHEVDWTGAIDAGDQFPDGFVCVEHSPYTLRIRIEGHGGEAHPPEAYTRFAVDLGEIELELGDKLALRRVLDKTLHDTIAGSGIPASGSALDLKLPSNVYKLSLAEMTTNAGYDAYATLWGSGPRVPVFASLKLKNTAGESVVAPKGLGKLAVVWEWSSVNEDTSGLTTKPKAFVDGALDFDKDLTEPVGDNCHVDRGGKRGPDAVPVFPACSGYAPADALRDGIFPFKVEPYTEQANISISRPWTGGVLGGKTGALFEPSRMAGDVWTLKVYLFRDAAQGGPAADAVQVESGEFKIWRQVNLVRQIKKTAAIPNANISTFGTLYAPASLEVVDDTTSVETMAAATYDAQVATAIAAQSANTQLAIDSTISQHGGGNWAITFRTWSAFTAAKRAASGWTAPQLAAWLAGAGSRYGTAPKYRRHLKGWAKTITTAACANYMHTDDGITIIEFIRLYNLETLPGSKRLGGWAPSVAAPVRPKCMFIMVPSSYGNAAWVTETLAHEIGHQLFLPHSPFPAPGSTGAPSGSGDWKERHDETDSKCIMSYSSGTLNFCGLCVLRLRGWSALWLSKTPGDNTRP